MPTKHAVLAELTAEELRANVDYYELEVADRRVKAQLVDALAGSRRARVDEILADLSRDRLKELCRALGLDDSGRKKADLVVRLMVPAGTTRSADKVAKSPAPSRPAAAPSSSTQEVLSVAQLEQYLWSAADILRGSIDSSDYKTYIFGLLFLKRLSDRFEEEAQKLIADGMSETVAWTDPDEHQFFVPDRARWGTIQKTATNIGEALNKACAALEEQNSALEGVLAGIDYNDERKLGDARNRDTVLARLVQHFSEVSLRNDRMAEPDLLGRAYEYLIEQFADDAGKKGGEFYTPRMVVKLIVELLAPNERMRICDPTAGSGGMLIECAHHIERKGGNPRNLTLHGQEKNLSTWAICKMNMLLHGLPDARIEKGDTIRDPKLVDEGELLLYDRVIANPPFSLDEWGRDVAENDGHARFRFGVPPKTKGCSLFFVGGPISLSGGGEAGGDFRQGVVRSGRVRWPTVLLSSATDGGLPLVLARFVRGLSTHQGSGCPRRLRTSALQPSVTAGRRSHRVADQMPTGPSEAEQTPRRRCHVDDASTAVASRAYAVVPGGGRDGHAAAHSSSAPAAGSVRHRCKPS